LIVFRIDLYYTLTYTCTRSIESFIGRMRYSHKHWCNVPYNYYVSLCFEYSNSISR